MSRIPIRRAVTSADASANGPAWRPFSDEPERTGATMEEYRQIYGGKTPAVLLSCPKGHLATLQHEIASDGTVTPSVGCPIDGCGWHVFVKLEGWA